MIIIGFVPFALFLLFLFLKISGDVKWPWWVVFAPLWVAFLLGLVITYAFSSKASS